MIRWLLVLLLINVCPSIQNCEEKIQLIKIENGEHQVRLSAGEYCQFEVETNPSTGYQWEIICPKGVDYEILDRSKEDDQPPLLGRVEKKILRIQTRERGQFSITLNYRRLWEDEILYVQKIFLEVE